MTNSVFKTFIKFSISFSVQFTVDSELFVSFSKGGSTVFSSLTVELETKQSFRQSAFSSSVNAHCVSPKGRVKERRGIAEDELLFLTKCLITFQN